MATKFFVVVETDGFGGFQARCLHCGWKSKWFERENVGKSAAKREAMAVVVAKEHGAEHANEPEAMAA